MWYLAWLSRQMQQWPVRRNVHRQRKVQSMLRTIAISFAQAFAIVVGVWLCLSLTSYVVEKDPLYTGPLLILVLYFLPIGVAALRNHNRQLDIIVIDLWLGWTVIGWMLALVWACDSDVEEDYA